MKFYNRENELAELKRIQRLSFEENSRLTVITGRRRIGKTSLIMKAVDETPTVYLFVGRKNEATLCSEFIPLISGALNIFVPAEIRSFTTVIQSAEGRTVRMWYSYAWTIMGAIQGRLLPVCYPVPDVRH